MPDATVHIVDDDHAVRRSLKLLIDSADLAVREYEGGQDFLDRYRPRKPECLLLDLRMPGMDGLELQRELRTRGIHISTLFLSGHGDIPIAVRALREGALDFIEKPFNNNYLLERVRLCIGTDAAQEQDRINHQEAEERLMALTKRERQVVHMLVDGKINKVIGTELSISTRTVESHRARIMKKLNVDSLSDIYKLVLMSRDGKADAEP